MPPKTACLSSPNGYPDRQKTQRGALTRLGRGAPAGEGAVLQLDRYIDAVLGRRWLVVGLAVLILLGMAAGTRYLTVSDDLRTMLSKDNPQLIAFDVLEATYSASNTVLIAIAPREGSVFTRETLGAIEELTAAAWQAPYSGRVDSLTNYTHSRALGDELIVEPLVEDAHSLSDADLARIEEVSLHVTELAGRLVSHDGRVSGLAINFVMPEVRDKAVFEATDYLHAMLDAARADHPEVAYYLTGNVVLNRTLADAVEHDMGVLVPIAFLVIVVGAALLLRSVLGTLAIVFVILFALSTTMGFAGWLGLVLSPTTTVMPVVVMVVAVAASVHIIAVALWHIRRGLDRNAAIAESLRTNAWPVFLTSVTTAIGFLSLNASDSPPYRELGNLVAFGVLCVLFYSMTLLPAMLSLLPLRTRRVHPKGSPLFERFGAFVAARSTPLLWFGALLVVGLVMGIPRNEVSDNWTKLFDERYEFRRATDFIIQNLTGVNSLEFSLKAGREGGITDPDYLQNIDAFAEWFRKQPEVTHVQAFSDVMKRLNKNMHGDDPTFYRLPDDLELAAQYLLLYELSLPFGSDLNDRIDVAKSATRMTVTVIGVSASGLRALDERAQAWLRANTPALATEASGMTMIFAYLTQRNIESMLRGTIIGMALISFILIGVFKSLRLGLISLVPNFIPAAMAFGLWGYVVGRVGLAGSIVTVVAFGIIVDDTIYFLSEYLKARREGHSAPEAVRDTFRTVGPALCTTTAALSTGFLVFAFSGYEGSQVMGLMVTITFIFALIADFLLLPPLLMIFDRRKL